MESEAPVYPPEVGNATSWAQDCQLYLKEA